MNPLPFSLHTTFAPEDAGEDKVDLELGGWEMLGLDLHPENIVQFKQCMASPPKGSEDFAWTESGEPPKSGKFFCRPGLKGNLNKIKIRTEGITHKATERRHEAPLCGGYCLFSKSKKPEPVSGQPVYRARLILSLNLQRFIRHQPQKDDPQKPWKYRLQRQKTPLTFYGDEQALDGEDNWIPDTPAWQKFAAREHFSHYLHLIAKEVNTDFGRACALTEAEFKHGCRTGTFSAVETLWEFPSSDPIGDALQFGARLMHLRQGDATVKQFPYEVNKMGRVGNAPSFVVTIAEGVTLRLYAKTNKRLRFEIIQRGLRKQLPALRGEAYDWNDWSKPEADFLSIVAKQKECPFDELPSVLKAVRNRAAKHMNALMEQLRVGRTKPVAARSVVNLLAQVALAVRAGLKSKLTQEREIKTLLYMLCYHNGYRGTRKVGPMAGTLDALEASGVIKFDRSRLFYSLTPPYVKAADALRSATGEPLLTVFGMNTTELKAARASKRTARLRE